MSFFDYIAAFFNAVIAAFQRIANFEPSSLIPKLPELPDLNPFNDAPQPEPGPSESGGSFPDLVGHKVTDPENIGATFYSEGSSAWVGQWEGTPLENKHGGIDFRGNQGTPVYAPYAGNVVRIGNYTEAGKFGDYVIMILADGSEYYSGHLQNVKVKTGDTVKQGQQIGETNNLNHTHIQLKIKGEPKDFLAYREAHQ